MKLIIFGAGSIGKRAYIYFGRNIVEYFIDNNKAGTVYNGKEVISFERLIEINDIKKYIIVVASEHYRDDMVSQLQKHNINNYFCFCETDIARMQNCTPGYWYFGRYIHPSYTEIVSNYDLSKYKNVVIWKGNDSYIPYLIIEILSQYSHLKLSYFSDLVSTNNIAGIPIINNISQLKTYDAIIINCPPMQSNVREWIDEYNIDVIDLYEYDKFVPEFHYPELAKYKDIHKGKRCFIVGTGPSLRIEDLDKLHQNKEICISCNKIYRAYDKTEWRADYYGFLDGRVIEDCIDDIPHIPGTVFLGDSFHYDINKKLNNVQYFHYIDDNFFPNYPYFSLDFTRGFYGGRTTTYSFGIQLAAYMGFKEIYLLGIDHCVTGNCSDICNHFISDYYRNDEKEKYQNTVYNADAISKAYEAAEYFSRKYNFRIFNATRGGKLDAFERVDFDSLFR